MEQIRISTIERLKKFLVVIATIGVIAVNWLAAKGLINGVTPEVISDKYPTLITPAGYAFAIWSLIYLGLIVFSIYQILPSQTSNPRFRQLRSIYILNCAANCFWIYLWHYDLILAALAVMFVILGTLVFINYVLQSAETTGEYWLVRIPFAVYFGWITAATILNFTIALVYLGVKPSDSTTLILASSLLIFAAFLSVLVSLKMKIFAYALTIAWALTAIAVKQTGATMIITVCAVGVIASLIAAIIPILRIKNPER